MFGLLLTVLANFTCTCKAMSFTFTFLKAAVSLIYFRFPSVSFLGYERGYWISTQCRICKPDVLNVKYSQWLETLLIIVSVSLSCQHLAPLVSHLQGVTDFGGLAMDLDKDSEPVGDAESYGDGDTTDAKPDRKGRFLLFGGWVMDKHSSRDVLYLGLLAVS